VSPGNTATTSGTSPASPRIAGGALAAPLDLTPRSGARSPSTPTTPRSFFPPRSPGGRLVPALQLSPSSRAVRSPLISTPRLLQPMSASPRLLASSASSSTTTTTTGGAAAARRQSRERSRSRETELFGSPGSHNSGLRKSILRGDQRGCTKQKKQQIDTSVALAKAKAKNAQKENDSMVYLDGPQVYTCGQCRTHLTSHDDIISKSFHGRHGRAYLFDQCANITLGPPEDRLLMTGMHSVCDIFCKRCKGMIGWTYTKAYEASQKYKEGKYIIEKINLHLEESDYYDVSHPAGERPDRWRLRSMSWGSERDIHASGGGSHHGRYDHGGDRDSGYALYSPRSSGAGSNDIIYEYKPPSASSKTSYSTPNTPLRPSWDRSTSATTSASLSAGTTRSTLVRSLPMLTDHDRQLRQQSDTSGRGSTSPPAPPFL